MNAKEARRLSEEAKRTAVERYNALVEADYPKIFARTLDIIEERASQGFCNACLDLSIMKDTSFMDVIIPAKAENIFVKIEKDLIRLGFEVKSSSRWWSSVSWENA